LPVVSVEPPVDCGMRTNMQEFVLLREHAGTLVGVIVAIGVVPET
jgi:hypothetical protein